MQSLAPLLLLMVPSLRLWLDTEVMKSMGDLEQAVEESDAFLLFLTRSYMESANWHRRRDSNPGRSTRLRLTRVRLAPCRDSRRELLAAWRHRVPIIVLRESSHERSATDAILSKEIDELKAKKDEPLEEDLVAAMEHVRQRCIEGVEVLWCVRPQHAASAAARGPAALPHNDEPRVAGGTASAP